MTVVPMLVAGLLVLTFQLALSLFEYTLWLTIGEFAAIAANGLVVAAYYRIWWRRRPWNDL